MTLSKPVKINFGLLALLAATSAAKLIEHRIKGRTRL